MTWPDILSGLSYFALDQSGNIFLSGNYTESTDFDPGPDSLYMDVETGEWGKFLGKFDQDGHPVWIKTWVDLWVWDITHDLNGDVYFSCSFENATDLDPSESVEIHDPGFTENAAVIKLDAEGNVQWAYSWGEHDYSRPSAIGLDNDSNTYITGSYTDARDPPSPFWSELGIDFPDRNVEAMLVKFDENGTLLWEKTWGLGAGGIGCRDLVIQDGIIYVIGYLWGLADFDPSNRKFEIQSNGDNDCFVSVFDLDGNWEWTGIIGKEEGYDIVSAIDIDSHGNIFITGTFSPSMAERYAYLARFSPQ